MPPIGMAVERVRTLPLLKERYTSIQVSSFAELDELTSVIRLHHRDESSQAA